MRLAASIVLIAIVCAPAHTQELSVPDTQTPPAFHSEVVVTAERGETDRARLSVPTSVLTAPQIAASPGVTLAEAFEMLPGFQMLFSSGSGFRPTTIARGFFGAGEAEYVKLLVDGVPLGDAEAGLMDWRHIPLLTVDRVEAVRGPASAVHGDTSLGGVIQIFTRESAARAARLSASGGSSGHRFVAGEYREPVMSAVAAIVGSYTADDGYREQSALREGTITVSVGRAHGGRQWHARAAGDYLEREEPGAVTQVQLSRDRRTSDPLFRGDRDVRRKGYGSARYASTHGRAAYNTSAHAAIRSGDRLRTLLLAPGFGDRSHRDISTNGSGATLETALETRFAGTRGDLRSGIDVSRDGLRVAYRAVGADSIAGQHLTDFEGRRIQIAGYATQSFDLGSDVRVNAGLRWDRIGDAGAVESTSHTAWSPKIGATWLFGPAERRAAMFVHASRAFKAATLDQLFDPRPFPDFRGGTFFISNAALRPQRGTSVEGGVRQTAGTFRWEALLYRMKMTDEIDFDPATFTYSNIGRSTHDGAEADASIRFASAVSAGVSYAWTRVTPDSNTNAQLKNIPRHLLKPHITLTFAGGTLVHARYVRTAGAYADDANGVPLRDRSSVDVRVAKKFARTALRVDLINVTDARYEEVGYVLADFAGRMVPFFYPAPGFAARAGVEFSF